VADRVRQRMAIPEKVRWFRHVTLVSHPPLLVTEDTPVTSLIGHCESERGQPVCSCGYYALAWDASGVETLFL
jgi:hypothetical protein